VLERAIEIAEDVLFPAAAEVDRADRVPRSQLDLLADEGFYGLFDLRRPEVQAPGEPSLTDVLGSDPALGARIVEVLAGGCLATTFVWMQHHGAVRAATASATPGVPEKWAEPLRRGQRRAGVSLAGVWPGPPVLRARRVDGGYLLDGDAPWVTGWDMIDTLYVAARDGDMIVFALLDAVPGPTLTATLLDLVAVQASRTTQVRFEAHFVPDDRVTGLLPHAAWPAIDAAGLRLNGSLALGVAARCCRLMGPGPLDAELDAARAALDAGVDVPAARAVAAELALRAAAALTVTTGSRAVLVGEHAQRLVREATFLLVFGSRPAIRTALVDRLIGTG
jgi:alkylation response protein AidB-like acyl-CoA dehydrogenase